MQLYHLGVSAWTRIQRLWGMKPANSSIWGQWATPSSLSTHSVGLDSGISSINSITNTRSSFAHTISALTSQVKTLRIMGLSFYRLTCKFFIQFSYRVWLYWCCLNLTNLAECSYIQYVQLHSTALEKLHVMKSPARGIKFLQKDDISNCEKTT